MIVITHIPRNAKEGFVTTTVVSCHTDDQTIIHMTKYRGGQNPNRQPQRLKLHPCRDTTSENLHFVPHRDRKTYT